MQFILRIIYSLYAIMWFAVLLLISLPLVLIIISLPIKVRDVWMHKFLMSISKLWFYVILIFPSVKNRELLLQTEAQVIIANHASYIDAPTLYTSIPYLFKTLGKEEMARIPIFKYMYKSAVITVNRRSTMARAKSFLQMQDALENKLNVVFFPEGTFDANQENLKPFFDGAFRLAIKAQKNIVPLLLLDTSKRMQADKLLGFSPGLNISIFLPPISTANLTLQDTQRLKQYCYEYMNAVLQYCKNNNTVNCDTFIAKYLQENTFKASNA